MILNRDISVVVQGPILHNSTFDVTKKGTHLVCAQVRKLFPECEIILSSWEGSVVDGINYDKLVLSKDPGGHWFNHGDYQSLNNCNRLIVSTQAGLKAATRKYVLKIRSDLFIFSNSFLKYFDKFPYYNNDNKFFSSRVLAFSIYSLKSEWNSFFKMPRPYHLSDWVYFGYKEDIENLYDIPLVDEPQFSQWFLNRCKTFYDFMPGRLWKMSPEQYITSTFFSKYTAIKFEHVADISNNNVMKSNELITNNFIILDQTQLQLVSLRHYTLQLLYPSMLSKTSIFYHTWLDDYYKYCNAPITNLNYIMHKIEIIWRYVMYNFFNKVLLMLNGKNQLVQKLLSSYIKKLAKKLI